MNDWQDLQELFESTRTLEASARAEVLRERAGRNEALARQVEALLGADSAPLDAFAGTAAELLEQLRDEASPQELCGLTFGPYRVEEYLSSGGMGHVYRATRTSAGTARRVALKVLRQGLDADRFLERFQRERELLATLEHEHIVSFLDAGALPDGRPYLVMELVEGLPLTDWGRTVSRRGRIELFLQVLAAVQYAHQQLVVHRDLKPSNVLVTAQGAPKLLDFGVAALASGSEDGVAPHTPTYASPEQLAGKPTATASDVYSLGVLLYELLTGKIPTDPTAVPIGPDLDAIVGKALAADPARRYASPDHLAQDLRRHLAGEAVSARRATWRYRTALFVRRSRGPIALIAALVLALVAGWVGSDLDRRSAEREASLGWGAHAQARVAARVFEQWIASITASHPELVPDAAAHLEGALRSELMQIPEAETLVRLALAELYLDHRDRARATQHVERAEELTLTTRGLGERTRLRAEELGRRIRAGG